MKNRFKILLVGVVAAFGGLFASCTDPGAEITDIDYARVLTPLNFVAEVNPATGTDIGFRWSLMQNADFYTLELFTDEGYTQQAGSSIKVMPGQLPIVVTGLDVDTDYYARVKGGSDGSLGESHWAFLEEPVTTFPVRPSLNPVISGRTMNSVTLSWNNAEDKDDLNSIRVTPVTAGGEESMVTLDEAALAACTFTIEGLSPVTEYKFTMIFGLSGQRGSVTAWTRPDTSGSTRIESAEALSAALQGAAAGSDLKLLLAYNEGAAYDLSGLTVPAITYSLYMYGESSADGKKPVVVGFGPNLEAGCTVFHLEDLVLDGNKNALSTLANNASANLSAYELVNCEIYDYSQKLYYANTAASNCDKFLIDGVFAHDINPLGAGGGDFIDMRNGRTNTITIRNSTFSFAARTFLRVSDSARIGTVEVSNCTFNAVTATASSSNNAGIFAVRVVSEATSLVANNNVFMNELSEGEGTSPFVRLVRNSADSYSPVFSKNYFYNVGAGWFVSGSATVDGSAFSEALATTDGGILTADPCVNSIGGKLYLTDPTIAASKVGDPRWWNAVQPAAPIRPTQLETVVENTTWDFTTKTLFDTETVSANTIIENIQFYATAAAPTEIVMGAGVNLPAGSVGADNVPTAGALGFRVDNIGTVKVTATGAAAGTYSVLVGSDLYPLMADGETHAVALGDIAGETMIYIVAGGAMNVTKVEWLTTLEPDDLVIALAKPAVSLDATRVDEGTEQAITASWAEVANAASYDVTFRGTTTNQTATSFTIDAATVAALPVGEYPIEVVAKPVATSTKFAASEAGSATLNIAKVVIGGEVTLTWDFSSPIWAAEIDKVGTNQPTDLDITVEGLRVFSGGGSMRAGAGYWQPGGAGSDSRRNFSFEAPASGTLRVVASNTGSSEGMDRMVTVNVNGVEQSLPGGYSSNTPGLCEFEITVDGPTTVLIYPTVNGLRFYSIEFTYIQSAGGKSTWDFSSPIWAAEIDKVGTNQPTDLDITVEGLRVFSGGGSMRAGAGYWQPGGAGSASRRNFSFEAPASGTLRVVASNTGSSEGMDRMVTVNVNGVEQSLPGGYSSNTPGLCEFEITVDGPTTVFVYPTVNGLRFYSIEYEW